MLHFYWQISFGRSDLIHNLAACRILSLVTNFCRPYHIAVSTARRLPLLAPGCPVPHRGRCATWSSQRTLLLPASFTICMSKSGHRFLYNLGTRSTALLCSFLSRLALSNVAVLLSLVQTNTPTTRGASQSSFIRSGTDRPSRTICSKLPADFQNSLHLISTDYPCDLHTWSPTGNAPKPDCRGQFSLTTRSPAIHLQRLGWPRGWDGRSSWRQSSTSSSVLLPPASFL